MALYVGHTRDPKRISPRPKYPKIFENDFFLRLSLASACQRRLGAPKTWVKNQLQRVHVHHIGVLQQPL